MLEQLRIRLDNPAQIASLNFMAAMFGDHPYGRDPLGRQESLSPLGPDEVVGHLTSMRSMQNLVISVTGHFDVKQVTGELADIAKQLPAGRKLLEPLPILTPRTDRRQFVRTDKEQVHLILGYPGLTLTDPDRYALQVLEAVLAGQGGRLFVELRDKASLAYSVSPLRMEGVETGYFGAYIGCAPDKGGKALRMLREQFKRVGGELIREDELARAQRYLIGRHDIDLQRNSAMAAALLFHEIYGIDFQETFLFPERIRAVTAHDVQRVARRLLAGPEILSAVGSKEPWADAAAPVERVASP
jgi:zinc protease